MELDQNDIMEIELKEYLDEIGLNLNDIDIGQPNEGIEMMQLKSENETTSSLLDNSSSESEAVLPDIVEFVDSLKLDDEDTQINNVLSNILSYIYKLIYPEVIKIIEGINNIYIEIVQYQGRNISTNTITTIITTVMLILIHTIIKLEQESIYARVINYLGFKLTTILYGFNLLTKGQALFITISISIAINIAYNITKTVIEFIKN